MAGTTAGVVSAGATGAAVEVGWGEAEGAAMGEAAATRWAKQLPAAAQAAPRKEVRQGLGDAYA